MNHHCDAVQLLLSPTSLPIDLLDMAYDLRLSVHPKINLFAETWLKRQSKQYKGATQDDYETALPDASLLDIQLIIRAVNAIDLIENTTRRSLMKRTYLCKNANNHVTLPVLPLLNIVQVRYDDNCTQALRIMQPGTYSVDKMHSGEIRIKVQDTFSDNRPIYKNNPMIEVKYETGYESRADIPMVYKHAIKNLLQQFYYPTSMTAEKEILDHVSKIQEENRKISSMMNMVSAQNAHEYGHNIYKYHINMGA